MKFAKIILLIILCILLAITTIMGCMVFVSATELVLPILFPEDTPDPAPTVTIPSTVPSTLPTIHECAFTIEVETAAPTCEQLGYTLYACECGKTHHEFVPALEHIYGDPVVIPPTCTEEGYTQRSCTREGCNGAERTNFTAPEHKFGDHEETPNYWKWECSGCGYIEQYSTESGPVWIMKITPLEDAGEYKHLHIYLILNGGMLEYEYDVYIGLTTGIPEFEYLNGCLMAYYPLDDEMRQYVLPADNPVLTIHANGLGSTEPPVTDEE